MSNYPNMSYCMFENTSAAVQQCVDALADDIDMKVPTCERRAMWRLVEQMNNLQQLLDEWEERYEENKRHEAVEAIPD